MTIDVSQLITGMKKAASEIIGQDITKLRGFSERQVTAIAKHAVLLERDIRNGEITEELQDYFLDNLEDMVLNFVKTLRGLMMVTIEKVWNAIVNVIWKAFGDILSIPLKVS